MEIKLVPYHDEKETAKELIVAFWKAKDRFSLSDEAVYDVLRDWTKTGDFLYFIKLDDSIVGFVHLNCAEHAETWRADLFVLPEHQGKGIDTHAIQLTEDILNAYSESGHPEAAARNRNIVPSYHHIGYRRLNGFPTWKGFPSKK